MSKTKLSISLIIIFLLTQSNAFAHHKFGNKFDKRLQKLSHTIEDGFYSGDFNYHELKKLFKTQHNLQRLSQEFLRDGHYGHKERKILRKRLDKFDNMIDRMRHNHKKYDYGQRRGMNRQQHKWRHKRYAHSS